MNKSVGIRITLIGAAAAAISIPLVAQLVRGPGPGAEAGPSLAATLPAAAPAGPSAAPARPTLVPGSDSAPATGPTTAPAATAPAAPSAPAAPATVPAVAASTPTTAPSTAPAVAAAYSPVSPVPTPDPAASHATPPASPAPTAPTTSPEHATAPEAGPAASVTAVAGSPATAPASRPASSAPAPIIRDAGGKPTDPNRVVVTVGPEKLTAGDVDAFISDLPPEQQAVVRSEGRRGLADYLVKTELLAQEAKSRRLDQDPRVQRQMRLVEDQVLARALINDVRDGVDDATVRKFFEEHRPQLERVHARHILVRTPGSRVALRPGQKELTEEQAKAKAIDIYNRVKAGGDFAKVAREESDDTGSGADGGDLGSVSRGRKLEAFEKAAFGLKEGEVSPPVRSPLGWHVIQVLERFDTPEKLAEQIRTALGPQKTQELIQGLEKDHKADVDDEFFGPPAPPEPALPEAEGPGGTPGGTGPPQPARPVAPAR